jgi:drug/metabolite transporter (DMT)-like permease
LEQPVQDARRRPPESALDPTALPHRNRLALFLALLAALFWGLLPLALQVVGPALDTYTITWCRFLVAGVVVGLFLARRNGNGLPRPWRLEPGLRVLLPIAVVGLTLNYTLFVVGVNLTSPATAQVVIQSANLFVLLGGLMIYHERFSRLQWLGASILIGGLLLFFNRRLPLLFGAAPELRLGVSLLIVGSLSWACYGLAQKRLLREWNSAQLLWLLYVGGALLLTPLAQPSHLRLLHPAQAAALLFCCLNTLIAYGAYAEAMHLGEVTRVSATVAVSPLVTSLASVVAAGWLIPVHGSEIPNLWTWLGVAAVVGGSALCALGAAGQSGS